jgi:hypothetical protein
MIKGLPEIVTVVRADRVPTKVVIAKSDSNSFYILLHDFAELVGGAAVYNSFKVADDVPELVWLNGESQYMVPFSRVHTTEVIFKGKTENDASSLMTIDLGVLRRLRDAASTAFNVNLKHYWKFIDESAPSTKPKKPNPPVSTPSKAPISTGGDAIMKALSAMRQEYAEKVRTLEIELQAARDQLINCDEWIEAGKGLIK